MQKTRTKYTRLTIVSYIKRAKYKRQAVRCRCKCGNKVTVLLSNLERGITKSCGCFRRDKAYKHGMAGTRLHSIWKAMRKRCRNPNDSVFKHYGGRGITVCKAWDEFRAFYVWAMSHGYTDALSLDRKKGNRGYYPSNCRWATRSEQSGNRRKSNGKSSRYIGVSWHKHTKRWYAYIQHAGTAHKLGVFKSEVQAAKARDAEAIRLRGKETVLNFPKAA